MRDQEIIGLSEAYASIYTQDDVLNEDAQQAVGKALDAAAKNPVIKAIGKVIAPVGKGRKTATATSGGYRPVKEDIDTFDIVLEYLVSEGFAETNENALAIMANMSEGWKQSIVEKHATFGYNADDPGDDFDQFLQKGPKTNKQKRNAIELNNRMLSKPGMPVKGA